MPISISDNITVISDDSMRAFKMIIRRCRHQQAITLRHFAVITLLRHIAADADYHITAPRHLFHAAATIFIIALLPFSPLRHCHYAYAITLLPFFAITPFSLLRRYW